MEGCNVVRLMWAKCNHVVLFRNIYRSGQQIKLVQIKQSLKNIKTVILELMSVSEQLVFLKYNRMSMVFSGFDWLIWTQQ